MANVMLKACEKCGAIMNRREDERTLSIPPKYIYDCPQCKNVEYDETRYPYTEKPELYKFTLDGDLKDPDWQSFRREAAKDILGTVISKKSSMCSYEEVVKEAIEFADELIKQLKKK